MAKTEAKKNTYPEINMVVFLFVCLVLFPCFLEGPKDNTAESQERYGSLASVPQVVRAKNENLAL